MRGFILIFVVVHASCKKHMTNHIVDMQDASDKLVEGLIDRALTMAQPRRQEEVDETMVGKPDRLVMHSSQILPIMAVVGCNAQSAGRRPEHHFWAKDVTPGRIAERMCKGHQYIPEQGCHLNSKVRQCMLHLPSRRATLCNLAGALLATKAPVAHAATQLLAPLSLYFASLKDAQRKLFDLRNQLKFNAETNSQPPFIEILNSIKNGELGKLEKTCKGADEYLCNRAEASADLRPPENLCPRLGSSKAQPSTDLLSIWGYFKGNLDLSASAQPGDSSFFTAADLAKDADKALEKLNDYVSKVDAAQALVAPKPVKEGDLSLRKSSGLILKQIKRGNGRKAKGGDRCVLEWSGYVVGEDGQPLQFQANQRTELSKGDEGYLLFELGKGSVIPAIEDGVLGMREGGVRQLIVDTLALGYPEDDPLHDRVGPKPTTASGQSALNSVLQTFNVNVKSLLFNIKLIRVDKPGQNGWKDGQISPSIRNVGSKKSDMDQG